MLSVHHGQCRDTGFYRCPVYQHMAGPAGSFAASVLDRFALADIPQEWKQLSIPFYLVRLAVYINFVHMKPLLCFYFRTNC